MKDKEKWLVEEIVWDKEDAEGTVNRLQDFLNDKAHEGYFFDAVETASNPTRFIVYMKLETDEDGAKEEWKTSVGTSKNNYLADKLNRKSKGHANE